MDITAIPPTVYVAFGVITASVLTGFFSFVNMVSSKENKVSEFRLAWIDGLRDEISEYTSAAQELVRLSQVYEPRSFHSEEERHALHIERYKESKEAFARATENLSRIQLRLNPENVKSNPDSAEAKLINAIEKARAFSIEGDFPSVVESCADIRSAVAPILKSTWSLVKRGEVGYRKIRFYSLLTVTAGFYAIVLFGAYITFNNYMTEQQNQIAIPAPINNTTELHPTTHDHGDPLKNNCYHSIPYRIDYCR